MENEGKIKCIDFYSGYRFLNWNHKSRNIEKNTSRITPVCGPEHCSRWAFSGLLTGAGGHVDDIVGVVVWPKSGDSSISMREIITTSVLKGFDKKKYFKGCSWFKCIIVRLVPDMTFKFYTSVAKGLKLSQKFSRTNCRVCRSYRAKTGRFFFAPILDRVKLWTSLEIDKNIILTRSLPICTAERLSHSCSLLTHSLITIHTDKILY